MPLLSIERRRLKLGDYVVHIEHGIAKFAGVTTMSINGSQKEYLLLVYADGKLYVPTDHIRRVKGYKGGDQPPLNRLDVKPVRLDLRKFNQFYARQEKNDLSTIGLDSYIS